MAAQIMQQACERCWKRKQRCDRQLPRCAVCIKANATCLPRRQGVVYNPEEPETWSYVESLEQRVARLEAASKPPLERHPSHTGIEASSEASPGSENNLGVDSGNTQSRDSIDNDADPAMLSYALRQAARLPLNAVGEPHYDESAALSMRSITLGSLFGAASRASGDDPRMAKYTGHTPPSLQACRALGEILTQSKRPPTRQENDVIQDALRRCGQFLASFLPFTDSASLEELRTSMQNEQTAPADVPLHARALVLFATAIGLMQYPSSHHVESTALRFAERAASLVPELLSSDVAEIPALQCLLALTVVTILLPQSGSTWHIFGLALSRYIASGIHTEGYSRTKAEVALEADRVCIAQCMYLFDTTLGVSLDRPFALSDADDSVFDTPSSRYSEPASFLDCHMHYANLLREIRDGPAELGFECHALNWRHWKTSAGSVFAASADDLAPELRDRHLGRLSCELLVCLLVSSRQNMWSDVESAAWVGVIGDELQAYISTLSRAVLEDGHALSSFDIYDVFNIAVAATDLGGRQGYQAGFAAIYDFITQTCTRLLTVGGVHFPFGRRLCDLLIEFLQLTGPRIYSDDQKRCEDMLGRHSDLIGARIQLYMKLTVIQRAHSPIFRNT